MTGQPFGSGIGGLPVLITSLAALPNGDLVVAGGFTTAGGIQVNNIARWNGTSWTALGTGTNSVVTALLALANGDVVAGGVFSIAGGIPALGVARWNGASWSALGTGVTGGVHGFGTLPNGDIVAGGDFTTAGGVAVNGIARWNGTSWSTLGGGVVGGFVRALVVGANGDVIVGGQFTNAGGVTANNIARWNGSSWSPLGAGSIDRVQALTLLSNGDLAVGSYHPWGGPVNDPVRKWNGVSWSTLGSISNTRDCSALAALPNGDIVACGPCAAALGGIARWDGSTWALLSPGGVNSAIECLSSLPNGDVIAGGFFTVAGGAFARGIARWSGSSWTPFGTGFEYVRAVLPMPTGDVVASPPMGVMRWNGVAWSAMGAGPDGGVDALTKMTNGDVVAGGFFTTTAGGITVNNIARWNGTSWSPLGMGFNGGVSALLARPNGDVIAGGSFTNSGGIQTPFVARWDGVSWSGLGAGPGGPVLCLATAANGDLVAGGNAGIAHWNGASWVVLGNFGITSAMTTLPNGHLVVTSSQGSSSSNLWRWNGTSWSPLGTAADGYISALTTLSNGDVMAGGAFWSVGGVVSAHVARLTTTCPAMATPLGSGCPSSGGNNSLSVTVLPWVGATFRATGVGLPATAFVFAVSSLTSIAQGAQPLAALLPQAVAGCDLLVAPDVLQGSLTTTGSAQSEIALPNTTALAGTIFYHQMVPVELGAAFAITATNALQLTVGVF